MLTVLLWLLVLALMLYLHGVVHRAGHALGGRFTGLGHPRSLLAESAGTRALLILRYPLPGQLAGRHSIAVHPRSADPSRAAWFAVVGGCAADLLLFLVAMMAVRHSPAPVLIAAAVLGGALFLLNALPLHYPWLESDAAALDTLRRGGAPAGRLGALAALEGAVHNGELPRAFDRRLIRRATSCPDGTRAAALADLFAYYRALDLGDAETASALLERLQRDRPAQPRALPAIVAGEAAFFAARLHNDAAAAKLQLRVARGTGPRGWARYWLARRSHPGPFARTVLQCRLLSGAYAEGQRGAKAGLVALVRTPADGPTAARHALCEREWLRLMLKEASALQQAAAATRESAPLAPTPMPRPAVRDEDDSCDLLDATGT